MKLLCGAAIAALALLCASPVAAQHCIPAEAYILALASHTPGGVTVSERFGGDEVGRLLAALSDEPPDADEIMVLRASGSSVMLLGLVRGCIAWRYSMPADELERVKQEIRGRPI